VEVTLALGIVSFTFLSMLGMLGIGLKTFKDSISSTVRANIAQQVINETQIQAYDPAYSKTFYFNCDGLATPQNDPGVIYTAYVTAGDFYLPEDGSNFLVNRAATATLLRVDIVNKTDSTRPNSFTLIWPKQ
jgi:uncharacterized protein (TIGR02598 family)